MLARVPTGVWVVTVGCLVVALSTVISVQLSPLPPAVDAVFGGLGGIAIGAVGAYLGRGAWENAQHKGRHTMTEQTEQQAAGDEAEHPDLTPDEYEDVDRDPNEPDDTEPEEEAGDGPSEGVAPQP
jgi:hypothetical protein